MRRVIVEGGGKYFLDYPRMPEIVYLYRDMNNISETKISGPQ